MSVVREPEARGISRGDIQSKGYTIQTTIDPRAQRDAEDAVTAKPKGQQQHLGAALVAVRPGTGEVVAYYGGQDGTGFHNAASPHPPGSSFAIYPGGGAGEQHLGEVAVERQPVGERSARRRSW